MENVDADGTYIRGVYFCIFSFTYSCHFFPLFCVPLEFCQGGVSANYKMYIAEKELTDVTYSEDGLALFRVQGTGPENMQAIQVEAVSCLSLHFLCIWWEYRWWYNRTVNEVEIAIQTLYRTRLNIRKYETTNEIK